MTNTQQRTATQVTPERALSRATALLLESQHDGGWWQGELETNVTMDAEDLLMRQFLGIRDPDHTEQSARWIRSQQRTDGSWANFHGGPPNVSTTAEAYVALRLAGDQPGEPHLRAAREIVLAQGGLAGTRVFTRIWLALFGEWSWDDVPVLPPEMVLLPSRVPLNIYDFACWARQTMVPLSILCALRPRRSLGFDLTELHASTPTSRPRGAEAPERRWGTSFRWLDRGLHRYEQRPVGALRRLALRRATEWVVARQEADGSWGGIQPPWVYSLMALHAAGRPLQDPVLQRGLHGWERFTIVEDTPGGTVRRVEACQSPVWDTALAVVALGEAGVQQHHPALERAAAWLCEQEVRVAGDWAVRRPGVAPGGWAFEFDNDGYPDVDDTAEVILALRCTAPTPATRAAIARGITWVLAMECRGGGWASFDADNTRELAYALPFCDFGAVTDPPSADVAAHVIEMLAGSGPQARERARRAVPWLLAQQEPDGSWFGRWGANHVYGTGAAVPALISADEPTTSPAVRRAVRWLADCQNEDGGWGEDLRSYQGYHEPPGNAATWRGRGASTASQTSWALLALEAAGEATSPVARRGLAWLAATQQPDGGWEEPQFTGTGFPGDFYINYHLYRLVFPVTALARCLRSAP